jgi:leucyl/phenylalanyl-tRNA--protein transferase
VIALPRLDRHAIWFPPPASALGEPNGLLAFGGDLRPERLLAAYQLGIFPWYQDDQPILWWSPDPRAVLFPQQIHISRSLRRRLRRGDFEVSMDRSFAGVMRGCAAHSSQRPGTWITAAMQRAYNRLHELGYAHSVEVWLRGELVGGVYGVALGRVFFGESMFSRATDASKTALVYLCGQLQQWGFAVIDCQVSSDHLRSLGASEVSRAEFQQLLELHAAPTSARSGRPWQLTWRWIELER